MDKLLSLCMIVKNEEKVLSRCLDSVQGLVDEIIVVDTGSEDRTKEIARSYTEHVYDFEWINDFSAAKNEAIRRATSQWILVLDADEYVNKDQHAELRQLLSGLDPAVPLGLIVPIYNFTHTNSIKFVESTAMRVFLNHPDIRFERPIHEQVTYRSEELPYANYQFPLYHTGYTQETMEEKKKNERNLQLFGKLKKENSFGEYDHFTLGNEYHTSGDIKRALSHYQKALNKKIENRVFYPHCLDQTIVCLFKLDRAKEALVYIEQGLKRWPYSSDYYCLKGLACDAIGLADEAIALFERAIELADSPVQKEGKYWIISPNYGNLIPFKNLHKLYSIRMDLNKSVYYLTKLIQLNSNDQVVLYQLLTHLVQKDSTPTIIGFLDRLYPNPSGYQSLQLFQVCLMLGHYELSEYYHELCSRYQVALMPHHRLYYALLKQDRIRFKAELDSLAESDNQAQINKLLMLASIIWQEPQYANFLRQTGNPDAAEEWSQLTGLHAGFFAEADGDASFDLNYVMSLLIDLLRMSQFTSYDWLIGRYPSHRHIIANRMGHHFFSQFQFELALDYYSILLNENQLDASGFRNLALLYMYQNEIDEGLEFVEKALELNPKQPDLFILYLTHCSDASRRRNMLDRFKKEYTQYCAIPLLKQKIKDQA